MLCDRKHPISARMNTSWLVRHLLFVNVSVLVFASLVFALFVGGITDSLLHQMVTQGLLSSARPWSSWILECFHSAGELSVPKVFLLLWCVVVMIPLLRLGAASRCHHIVLHAVCLVFVFLFIVSAVIVLVYWEFASSSLAVLDFGDKGVSVVTAISLNSITISAILAVLVFSFCRLKGRGSKTHTP